MTEHDGLIEEAAEYFSDRYQPDYYGEDLIDRLSGAIKSLQARNAEQQRKILELEHEIMNLVLDCSELQDVVDTALKAICLTRDYVGPDELPAIYPLVPDCEWAKQFQLRVDEYDKKHSGGGNE